MPAPSGCSTFRAIVHAEVDDWTPANERTLFGWQSNQQNLEVLNDGRLRFRLTGVTDGVSGAGLTTSTVAPSLTADVGYYFLVDYDNGTDLVRFYYSTDDPGEVHPDDVSWTQIGSDVAVTGTPSSAATQARLGDSGSGYFDGKIRRFWLEIDGTIEADVDFRYLENGDTSFTDLAGKSWTGNVDPFIVPAVTIEESMGVPQINQTIFPTGIASAEAFGTGMVGSTILPTGIASGEAFGTATINQTLVSSGIPSSATFGEATIVLTIHPSGIASGEAFGLATIDIGTLYILPSGIPSEEAFGTPSVGHGLQSVGIPSEEAFGTPRIILTIFPSGIASAEAFGTAVIGPVVSPSGIPSAEAFGVPTINQTIFPSGIGSAEAFGIPQVNQTIFPTGVPSAEAFGAPTIDVGLMLTGIPSAEAFGTPRIVLVIHPSGIASAEAFGSALVGHLTIYDDVVQTITLVTPIQTIMVLNPVQTIRPIEPVQEVEVEQTVTVIT
jgi:hypothetical protein